MHLSDYLNLAGRALQAQPLRALLIALAMAIGVAAMILLTTLGDTARRYITDEFASLGSNLLIVLPGRNETTGGQPPLFGATPRDLTLDDASALLRSPHIRKIAPITVGSAPVSWQGREREINILGSSHSLESVRHLKLARGRFLPPLELERAQAVCVIGPETRDELFGSRQAIGQWLRIADRRFRVIGVLASEGHSIGVDFDDTVIIPVASAQALFDTPALFRILAEAKSRDSMPAAAEAIRRIIRNRHEGEDDITVITQDSVIATFDRILRTLTLTVAGIATISLTVAGILIMNVMLVSVAQRTAEIGLLKAIGATAAQLRWLFLAEAALLSLLGAAVGLGLGLGGAALLRRLYPDYPIATPIWALVAALLVALGSGLVFGVLPASRAAKLDPIQALARR